MNEKLLAMYLEHASTDDAMAILFVKKNMQQSGQKWVDIIDCDRYESYELNQDKLLHFRSVEYGLYKRTIKPKYPPKSEFTNNGKFDERNYYTAVRAITWEAANRDIAQQKEKGIIGETYLITGVRYNKNKSKVRSSKPEWVYEIKSIKKLNSGSDR